MNSRALTTAAIAALTLAAGAQAQSQLASSNTKTAPITGAVIQLPTYYYNVQTGQGGFAVDPDGAVGSQRALGTCYANSAFSGSFTTLAPGDEFFDWGIKSCVGTGQIGGFTVGYGTTAADISIGGPGASVDIAMFQDALGGGDPGTEIARFAFTGLPSSTSGGAVAFTLPVSLVGGEIPVCDGTIGWSYVGIDGATGPLLVFTTGTCFGTPDPTTGTTDCFDIYSTPATAGSYVGTFAFSTAGISSFWLDLDEWDGTSSTSATFNGSGANPALFSETATPVSSQPWVTAIDLAGNPGAIATVIVFTDSLFAVPAVIGAGEVIVDITSPSWLFNDVNVATPGAHSNLIPKDITLIGNDLYAQGAIFDPSAGGLIFLNGIAFTLGL